MSEKQVNSLIKLFHHCIDNKGAFTLGSHEDMKLMWEGASYHLTGVRARFLTYGIYSNLLENCPSLKNILNSSR